MNAINVHVGAKLREARVLRKLTREQLAEQIGVTVAQVQKYETGQTRVSAAALFVIAGLLEMDITFFYEGLEPDSTLRPVRN